MTSVILCLCDTGLDTASISFIFVVLEYFEVELDVSLLIRCVYVPGPYEEITELVHDCIFLPLTQNNEKTPLIRILLS